MALDRGRRSLAQREAVNAVLEEQGSSIRALPVSQPISIWRFCYDLDRSGTTPLLFVFFFRCPRCAALRGGLYYRTGTFATDVSGH